MSEPIPPPIPAPVDAPGPITHIFQAQSYSTMESDNEEPGKKKRRRTALSCTECKRLKVKCDRTQPCASCTRRGVQNQCQFSDPADCPPRGSERLVTWAEYADLKARHEHLKSRFDHLESFVHQNLRLHQTGHYLPANEVMQPHQPHPGGALMYHPPFQMLPGPGHPGTHGPPPSILHQPIARQSPPIPLSSPAPDSNSKKEQ